MATKTKARKARGDSKLDTLPPEKKADLIDGLVCGWTYRQAADWLDVECGVSVSGSAWTPFYERHVEPILKDIRNFAKMSARSLAKKMEKENIFEQATIMEFEENAYQLMRTPGADPEEKRKWMETLLKKMAGQRDNRKLVILETKAKQADEAAGVAANVTMTPEEKQARLKQIFGMG